MPGLDERLERTADWLADEVEPGNAFDRVATRKVRRRVIRRASAVGLVVAVLAGTIGGTFALTKVFRSDRRTPPAGQTTEPASLPLTGNGMIAFTSNRDGDNEIYAMNPDGSGLIKLTDNTADDHGPAWSPDGTRIAFVSYRDGHPGIYVMNADGSGAERLRDGLADSPVWSPDGKRIAFIDLLSLSGNASNDQLLVMNADGTGVTSLTGSTWVDHASRPSWSPDGQRILFASIPTVLPSSCGYCLFLHRTIVSSVGSDGTGVQDLTAGPRDRNPSWSPDGTKILFSHGWQIATMKADGSDVATLTGGDPDLDGASVWSPDGTEIAFTRIVGGEGAPGLFVMQADGTGTRVLADSLSTDGGPTWQPLLSHLTPIETASSPITNSPTDCDSSQLSGDFDGDGLSDRLFIAHVGCSILNDGPGALLPGYHLEISWGNGATGFFQLPDCTNACRARNAIDLERNGIDELVLVVGEGGTYETVEVFELATGEAFGLKPAVVQGPGYPPAYPGGQTAKFLLTVTSTHANYLTCTIEENQSRKLIATSTMQDLTAWQVHETVFSFVQGSHPYFTVVSTRNYTAAFDPNIAFPVPGDPCLGA